MSDDVNSRRSLYESMHDQVFEMFFRNISNRICKEAAEFLPYDFFTKFHSEPEQMLAAKYQDNPATYICNSRVGLFSEDVVEVKYLVVGRNGRVVMLLEPGFAKLRNLPGLAVLHDGFFRPYLGCPCEYWQEHIEPATRCVENVLYPRPQAGLVQVK